MDIIWMVTREYLPIIAITCLVSWPVAYYLSSRWFNNFAYAIDFGIGNYFLGLCLLAGIVLLSNLHKILWSIKLRPIKSVKDE